MLQSRFEFTAADRDALAGHLCEGGHADAAPEILGVMERWVGLWREFEARELARRTLRDRDIASAKKINRSHGKKVADLPPPATRGAKSHSKHFVECAACLLAGRGVRIVRGPDKHQWLTDFFAALCRIAGVDRPSVDEALKAVASSLRKGDWSIRWAEDFADPRYADLTFSLLF
jgi:hypothetical protein